MVGQRRAWNAIIALTLYTRSDDVQHGMTSWPLGKIPVRRRRAWHSIIAHGQHTRLEKFDEACHRRLWTTQREEQYWAWHAIISLV